MRPFCTLRLVGGISATCAYLRYSMILLFTIGNNYDIQAFQMKFYFFYRKYGNDFLDNQDYRKQPMLGSNLGKMAYPSRALFWFRT